MSSVTARSPTEFVLLTKAGVAKVSVFMSLQSGADKRPGTRSEPSEVNIDELAGSGWYLAYAYIFGLQLQLARESVRGPSAP
jgi:hypothetical protein